MHFITSFEAQLRDICIPKNIFPKLANINERQTHNLEIFKRGKRDDEGEEEVSRRISRANSGFSNDVNIANYRDALPTYSILLWKK